MAWTALSAVAALTIVVCGGAIKWEDVTHHHDHERGLAEQREYPEHAFVQRVASGTVFVYHLLGDLADEHGPGRSLELPLCTGGRAVFRLQDSGVMPRELQSEYPEIRSYVGISADGLSADIVVAPVGVRAQIWTLQGRCLVDPHTLGRSDLHTVYHQSDREPGRRVRHGPSRHWVGDDRRLRGAAARRLRDARGDIVLPKEGPAGTWTYKLAIACSYEYVQFSQDYGGPMALLTTTVTRWTGIWKRDIGITFTLVPDQSKLFNFAAGSLPNNNNDAWFNDPRYGINAIAGAGVAKDSFDMGHFFHVGDAGGVGGCCPCDAAYKIRGGTAGTSPVGDNFDVDYVAHEAGHQFMAMHTWSGNKGSCTPDNFDGAVGVELGSGLTLMSYAGVCASDDLAKHADPYFHVISLSQFQTWSQTDGQAPGCGVYKLSTTNQRPTAVAPDTCVIPKLTPFMLQGSGTDPDGDQLWYTWAQVDAAVTQQSLQMENFDGPLFIAVPPSPTGYVRYFPRGAFVLDAADSASPVVDPTERLSTVARTLNFALTVRDRSLNDSSFGSWHSAQTQVAVSGYGPLAITAPSATTTLNTGPVTVTWVLNGASGASSGAVDNSMLAAAYDVAFTLCSTNGSSAPPSASGCGSNWTTLATGQTATSKGVGSASVFLPTWAVGTVMFRVQGVAPSTVSGCLFYAVTGRRTVGLAPQTTVLTVATLLPANGSSAVPVTTSQLTAVFSSNVYLNPLGIVAALVGSDGSVANFSAADLQVSNGGMLSFPLTGKNFTFQGSSRYTVNFTDSSLCSSPPPCPAANLVTVPSWSFSTLPSGQQVPLPSLVSLPAAVAATGLLNLTYNDTVLPGNGLINLNLRDASNTLWCQYLANSTGGTADFLTIQLDLSLCQLYPSSQWLLSLPPGAVISSGGTPLPAAALNFSTLADTSPPVLLSSDPSAGAVNIPEAYIFYLNFDRYIKVGNSSAVLSLMPVTGGPAISVNMSDCCDVRNAVTISSDTGEVFVSFYQNLSSLTNYSLVVPPGALAGFSNFSFPGLAFGDLTFVTGSTARPQLKGVNFARGSSDNLVAASLSFSTSSLKRGIGSFWLVDSNNITGASVSVKDTSKVSISGGSVEIDFKSTPLPGPSKYFLQWAGGILLDASGNSVLAKTDWSISISTTVALSPQMMPPLIRNSSQPPPWDQPGRASVARGPLGLPALLVVGILLSHYFVLLQVGPLDSLHCLW